MLPFLWLKEGSKRKEGRKGEQVMVWKEGSDSIPSKILEAKERKYQPSVQVDFDVSYFIFYISPNFEK